MQKSLLVANPYAKILVHKLSTFPESRFAWSNAFICPGLAFFYSNSYFTYNYDEWSEGRVSMTEEPDQPTEMQIGIRNVVNITKNNERPSIPIYKWM
jgi:hypothetical protein